MFSVGSAVDVRAAHRMPDHPPPEDTLHEHDYRIEVVVERSALDESGMVCDLDVVDAALARLARRIAGRDLEEIRPADVPAVTVEVFAKWAHSQIAPDVRAAGAETLAVRVWESEAAFGGYRASVS